MTWIKTVFCENNHLVYKPFTQVNQCPQNGSSHPEVFCEKGVLKNFAKFTGKHLCQSFFVNKVAGLKPAQVFSCEICKMFKNTFFHRIPSVAVLIIWRPSKKEHLFDGRTTSGCFWSSLLLLLITLIFVFDSNSKGFRDLNLVSHFHWSNFHRCYFLFQLFPCFFLSFSVLFHFFLSLLIKRILLNIDYRNIYVLSWESIKMFLPTLTSLKYVHVSK